MHGEPTPYSTFVEFSEAGCATRMRPHHATQPRDSFLDETRDYSLVESCYRGTFSTVKTRKSERQIPMSPIVLVALRKWCEPTPGGPDDLVFATRRKKPLSDGNLLKRYVYPACDRLKIPRVSWHMFRHLHGTLLSQLGAPVAAAQAQLGHADPRITLQI